MDKKTFRKKILKNGASKWCFTVLTALTVLFLALGAVLNSSGREDAVNLRLHRDEAGTYAFVDISEFHEWVCTYNDETVCCLYHQKKDFISVPYEPKNADYLKQDI